MRRVVKFLAGAGAAVLAASLAIPVATAPPAAAASTTVTWTTPGTYTYTVPAFTSSVAFTVVGAAGQNVWGYPNGYTGGGVSGSFAAAPGTILTVDVGGANGSGYYPGGPGGGGNQGGGGGGGASDIRGWAVGGGGGGDGYGGGGGGGGYFGGGGGGGGAPDAYDGRGGTGGTQAGPGFGGAGGSGVAPGGSGSGGIQGRGGDGGQGAVFYNSSCSCYEDGDGGGGGGGGYFGGGGGGGGAVFYNSSCSCYEDGYGGGGGGGSSWAAPSVTNVSFADGSNRGNGFVTITPLIKPSTTCQASGGTTVLDQTTEGITTLVATYQPSTSQTWVCVSVADGTTEYGGALELTPTEPGVSPPSLGGAPSTDGNGSACTTTTPNAVPGAHPVSSGTIGGMPYLFDAYSNGSSTAWVCVEEGIIGNERVVVSVPTASGGGVSPGTDAAWYPDPGTP